jgi:hypothetical protein
MRAQFGRFASRPLFFLITLLAWSWVFLPEPALIVGADSAGRVVPTGNTVELRFDHTATLLPNGKVLVTAGMARNGVIEPTAELYDPHRKSQWGK